MGQDSKEPELTIRFAPGPHMPAPPVVVERLRNQPPPFFLAAVDTCIPHFDPQAVENRQKHPELDIGDGFISRMDAKGENLELKFIGSLNAPKGMVVVKNTLYVCDIDELG